jgi:hypothetical protein
MGEKQVGSKCQKCGKIFFEVVDKCPVCGEQTEPSTWHKRIRVERLAMVGTLGLAGGVVSVAASGSPANGLVILAIIAAVLLSGIHTANFMFGFGGGFVERIPNEQAPPHAACTFDTREYGKESLRVVGIILAAFLVVGLLKGIGFLLGLSR